LSFFSVANFYKVASQHYLDAAYCLVVVCLSVCLSVTNVNPAKAAEPITTHDAVRDA